MAAAVERLRGFVDISSEPGAGVRFKLTLPLTLTTLRGLLVQAGGRTWVFDATDVARIVRVSADDIRSAEGRDVLVLDTTPCRLGSLADILGLSGREPVAVEGRLPVLIVKVGDQEVGFAVDELIAEQDVLIKSLGSRLVNVPHVAAATILADGEVALILDSAQLVHAALGPGRAGIREAAFDETRTDSKKRILVVDDSVTTRSLIQTVLEAAGYDVTVAVDGADGWRLLQDRGADLVVTDVEMPRMDGFALTENIRGTEQWRDMT